MAQPAEAGAQLSNEIVDRVFTRDVSPFEIAGYERRAKALAGRDPFLGYMARGVLAAAKDDFDEARRFHDMAIRHNPRDPAGYINYAASMRLLHRGAQAYEAVMDGVRRNPDDAKITSAAAYTAFCSGRFHSAKELRDRLRQMKIARESDDSIGRIAALSARHQCADEATARYCGAFDAYLRGSGEVASLRVDIAQTDEVTLVASIDASVDRICEMSAEFAETLAHDESLDTVKSFMSYQTEKHIHDRAAPIAVVI